MCRARGCTVPCWPAKCPLGCAEKDWEGGVRVTALTKRPVRAAPGPGDKDKVPRGRTCGISEQKGRRTPREEGKPQRVAVST